MKKILGFIIALGFVIMIGAAGGADNLETSFGTVLLLELLGMALSFFGMVALSHYKRYLRSCRVKARKRRMARNTCAVRGFSEKELA